MVTVIPQRQLRNTNAEILDRVEAGERFVVTRNGVAVADVVPHTSHLGPPRFPKTSDLPARQRVSGVTGPDRGGLDEGHPGCRQLHRRRPVLWPCLSKPSRCSTLPA